MQIGDVVSRDGTDEHLVYHVNDAGDLIGVVCIKEPSSDWTKIGETERNLTRRYSFINKMVNWEDKISEILNMVDLDSYDRKELDGSI